MDKVNSLFVFVKINLFDILAKIFTVWQTTAVI